MSESIFPRMETFTGADGIALTDAVEGGLTKRELFAILCAQAFINAIHTGLEEIPRESIKMTDKLLAALKKGDEG